MIGIVRGGRTGQNRDSDHDVLLLQVQMSDDDSDIQTVEFFPGAGEDANPADGSRVEVVRVADGYKIVVAVADGITPSMKAGEKKIYSLSAGAIAAFVNFLDTGVLELNGNADYAVRYTALETAFNQLKSDFNAHIHTTTATVGAAATPGAISTPTAPSTADITPAKIETVKTP